MSVGLRGSRSFPHRELKNAVTPMSPVSDHYDRHPTDVSVGLVETDRSALDSQLRVRVTETAAPLLVRRSLRIRGGSGARFFRPEISRATAPSVSRCACLGRDWPARGRGRTVSRCRCPPTVGGRATRRWWKRRRPVWKFLAKRAETKAATASRPAPYRWSRPALSKRDGTTTRHFILMAVAAEVQEEGPIAHIDIDRYEDEPGLESAIEHYGVSPTNATYRLLLIDVAKILETRWFPTTQRPAPAHMVEALAQRRLLPP